jgi:L-asparagine transporter-like permease
MAYRDGRDEPLDVTPLTGVVAGRTIGGMSEAPQRPSIRARMRVARAHLLIALLKHVQRLVSGRAFKVVLRVLLTPILLVWLVVFSIQVLYGRGPKWLTELNPEVAQAMAQLEEAKNKPIHSDISDREHAALQATTWGMAGAGVVIEVAIATSSKTLGFAMSVSAGCFAIAIPLLIALGFVQSHLFDPKKDRPTTTREMLSLTTRIYATQFLFCVGLTAMLFDFNRLVAIAFLVGCLLALRSFHMFVVPKHQPKVSANNSREVTMPEKSPAPEPATNEEEMRRMLKDNARVSGAVTPTKSPEDPSGDDAE